MGLVHRIVRLVGAVALCLSLFSGAANADKKAAKDAYVRGIKQYNLGEFKAALAAFTDAYNAHPDPSLLFNLGQCHRQLGDRQKAVTLYRSYLRETGEPPNAVEVRRLIAVIEEALAKDQAKPAEPEKPAPVNETPVQPQPQPVAVEPTTSAATTTSGATSARIDGRRDGNGRVKLIAGATVAALGVGLVASGAALVALAGSASDKLTAADRAQGQFDAALYDRGKTFEAAGIATLAIGGACLIAGVVVVALGVRERGRPAPSAKASLVRIGF